MGSGALKATFVTAKIEKWIKNVRKLNKITKEEPHHALNGFNIALSSRWTFLQRIISHIARIF